MIEYDRIYELVTEASPDLNFEMAIDKSGNAEATKLLLSDLSDLIYTDILPNVLDYICPIGGVIALHKSFTGVPAISDHFLEVDGSVINDPDSPLNGETLPDWNGDERFLCGHPTTTGTEKTDTMQGWQTGGVIAGTTRYGYLDADGNAPNYGAAVNFAVSYYQTGSQGSAEMITAKNDGTHGEPRIDSITQPINASIIWIMRIK